ncbi:hypothetical protein GOP47_0015830 [Adiantum capillus-veneris]|uniref:Pollen Ole e 1 allergen and extensin family protein n=1 Tax=Adiantum capillus-veneris TaxID=13818 RepID=A0A9D4UKE8_ADICA|nr:hypothetical protein GOP47_0015830 [Adiantum capillus-veneris]
MERQSAALMANFPLLLILLLPRLTTSSAPLPEAEDGHGRAAASHEGGDGDTSSSSSSSYRHRHFGKYRDSRGSLYSNKLSLASSSTPPPSIRASFALAVEGVVHCQHCKHVGTDSLLQSTPLPGAKVRLACRNMVRKTFVYKTAYTNAHGYFKFLMVDYNFRLHKGVGNCIVYLISSPRQSCYKATNINTGRNGAPLTRKKVYPNLIVYSVGPFAFAPRTCNVPSSYFRLSKSHYRFSESI